MNDKYLTSHKLKFIVVLLCALFLALPITYKVTLGQSRFCGLCHMMKPEFYTQQASTHARLSCVACHMAPGADGIMKSAAAATENLFRMATGTYVAPIRLLKPLDDRACERCHNMNTRVVSASVSDLVIPHDKHKRQGINCSKCHAGVAHGNIANRKVTYEADYGRWDPVLGESLMSDFQQLIPSMEQCMRCHQLRKVTTSCKACHLTGMVPEDHKPQEFRNGGHGRQAAENLQYCDSCHGYMSQKQVEVIKDIPVYQKILDKQLGRDKTKPAGVSVNSYARQNTFCKDCHGKRPPSHTPDFPQTHGSAAKADAARCATCHDNQPGSAPDGTKFAQKPEEAVTMVTCGKCHPSSHYQNHQWKQYHPIEMPNPPKLIKSCYDCHSDATCGSCHGKIK